MLILKGFDEKRLVLPTEDEPSTSPLPMECSTTELRQHARIRELGQKAPTRRADPCHKARGRRASARTACAVIKSGRNQPGAPADAFNWLSRRIPRFPAQRRLALLSSGRTLKFDHFAGFTEFDEIDALELPFADIGGKFQRGIVGAARWSENWITVVSTSKVAGPQFGHCTNGERNTICSDSREASRCDRRTPQSDANCPGSVAAKAPACGFQSSARFPLTLFKRRCIRTGPR